MSDWTLEYSGQEKAFSDWGLALDVERVAASCREDVLTVRKPGPMDAAALFAYGGAVIVRRDRTGSGTSWSGGSVYFRGKAALPSRHGDGLSESVVYPIKGPWWDLTRLVFQQTANFYDGDPEALAAEAQSEVMLGQAIDGTRLTTGEVIEEALDWAIACGVSLQKGTIDPATYFPFYATRDVACSEVIRMVMRYHPDCIAWFDYSTSPPTFHVRALANLSAASVGLSDLITQVQLAPRYDLQLPAVCLRFKVNNTVDGEPWVQLSKDTYPVLATGTELGALVQTIELQGNNQSNQYAAIVSEACDAKHSTEANRLAWWKKQDATLASDLLDELTIPVATVVDDNGDAIDLDDFPYVLLDGQVTDWMVAPGPVAGAVVNATVKATATMDIYAESGLVNAIALQHQRELSVRVRLTNLPTDTYWLATNDWAAEPIPTGMAQALYDAHAGLQYEGSLDVIGASANAIGLGKKLTVDTGTTTYTGLLIQEVRESAWRDEAGAWHGKLSLQVGPPNFLGTADLIELLRSNRYRITIRNPNTRLNARGGFAGTVGLGEHTAKQDTTAGPAKAEVQAIMAPAATSGQSGIIQLDAQNQVLRMGEIVDSTGADASAKAKVILDLLNDAYGLELRIREWTVCIAGVGQRYALFLSSDYYETSVLA